MIIDTLLALKAIYAANYTDSSAIEKGVMYLLSQQNMDGGFSYTKGMESSIYLTSLVVLALLNYKDTYSLGRYIDRSVDWLVGKQHLNGSFGDEGGSTWETSLAYCAIVRSGKLEGRSEKLRKALEYIKGTQLDNGSWDNDPYSTALALQALKDGVREEKPDLAISSGDITFLKVGSSDTNLSSSIEGFSSEYPRYIARNAIDSNLTTSWYGEYRRITNQWIIVSLKDKRTELINKVVLTNYGGGQYGVKDFKIYVSTTGISDSDFKEVYSGTLPYDDKSHAYEFFPVLAKYVKLLCVNNYGSMSFMGLREFSVYGVKTFEATTRPIEDEVIAIGTKIKNIGEKGLENVPVQLTVHTSRFIEVISSIAPWESKGVQVIWRVIPGIHDVRVEADPMDAIDEKDERNNISNRILSVATKPDLAISGYIRWRYYIYSTLNLLLLN